MADGDAWITVLVWQEDKTMMTVNVLVREVKFMSRDRTVWLWLAIILGLSTVAIGFGLAEVKRQHTTIQSLIEADQKERLAESAKLKNWGSAAYYSFHLTYDPPSDLAYAAMGLRDSQPWKHRIRMLALEGQIYERDVGNPSIALIGRFDFAFFTAFIVPLILIMLLYDIRTSEKTAGRFNLLEATVGHPFSFWFLRAGLRTGAVYVCLIAPLVIAGIISGTTADKLMLACLYVFAYTVFWALICFSVSSWNKPGSAILMTLITLWVLTAVVLPAGARYTIDRSVPVPPGADILMLQRETVNDAWDLPREVTMDAFFARHPEWAEYEPETDSFEWPWYYAFQQVGDQQTGQLSSAYRDGRIQRSQIANWVSLLTPPSLLERSLQSLAKTDLGRSILYEEKVRAYHAALRDFYYPKFFRHEPFDKTLLKDLPTFKPID